MSAIQNAITVLDKMDERLSAHGYLDTDGPRVEIKEAIQALQSLEGEAKPFAYCFTDVNGKPSEFCDSQRHASEGDLRIRTPLYTAPQPQCPEILKGIAFTSGDGWKSETKAGDVVYVWDAELPEPYESGQYPRVGNPIHSASTKEFEFTPIPASEFRPVIDEIITEHRTRFNSLKFSVEQPQPPAVCMTQILKQARKVRNYSAPDEVFEAVPMSAISGETVLSESQLPAVPGNQRLVNNLRESVQIQERKIERLSELLQKASDYKDYLENPEESPVWIWQGDGEDHPDSMVNSLTVVIRADQLRALIHSVPDGICLDPGHRDHKKRTGESCSCPKYIRHPGCTKTEIRDNTEDAMLTAAQQGDGNE